MVALWETIRRSNINKRKSHLCKEESELTPQDYHARDAACVVQFRSTGKHAEATIKAINQVGQF